MFGNIWKNIGKKLKLVAQIWYCIGVTFSLLGGIVSIMIVAQASSNTGYELDIFRVIIIPIGIILLTHFTSWVIYGLGLLVESVEKR